MLSFFSSVALDWLNVREIEGTIFYLILLIISVSNLNLLFVFHFYFPIDLNIFANLMSFLYNTNELSRSVLPLRFLFLLFCFVIIDIFTAVRLYFIGLGRNARITWAGISLKLTFVVVIVVVGFFSVLFFCCRYGFEINKNTKW